LESSSEERERRSLSTDTRRREEREGSGRGCPHPSEETFYGEGDDVFEKEGTGG